MNLKDIPNSVLKEKAHEIGTSFGYLIQLKYGHSRSSRIMAERIEKALGIPKERVMWPDDAECCPCEDQAANES